MSDQMTNEEATRILLGPTQREILQRWCDRILQAYDEKRLIEMDFGVHRDEAHINYIQTIFVKFRT